MASLSSLPPSPPPAIHPHTLLPPQTPLSTYIFIITGLQPKDSLKPPLLVPLVTDHHSLTTIFVTLLKHPIPNKIHLLYTQPTKVSGNTNRTSS